MSYAQTGVQAWINRGVEAYWHSRLAEAAEDFERAIGIDPQSVQARLSLGVICLFLYQNGISDARARIFDTTADPTPSHADLAAELDQRRALITEQNSTNAARAEKNLQQALQLDPQNKLAMEYLAALYYRWLDPDEHPARLDDAQHWYKRILEIYPEHKFGNYVCGVIDWQKAFRLMQSYGGYPYPRPLPNEEARRSLRTQIAPLLDLSAGNLVRSLQIDPNNSDAMIYLLGQACSSVYSRHKRG